MNYGFIGFGNLAKAIYHGLKHQPDLKFAYHSKSNQHQEIQSLKGLKEFVAFADVIWLCVKPQVSAEVLDQLSELDLKGKLVVSTLAGKRIEFIETHLQQTASILRIMPNLAMAHGQSVTAYCANAERSELVPIVQTHLTALGEWVELPEEQFDLFTAIFGSGPAFLLEILQAFKNQLNRFDLPAARQDALLAQLLSGTAAYFKENVGKRNLKELIEAITSEGGVTEAGLRYFEEQKMGELTQNVIRSAEERGKEMRK